MKRERGLDISRSKPKAWQTVAGASQRNGDLRLTGALLSTPEAGCQNYEESFQIRLVVSRSF